MTIVASVKVRDGLMLGTDSMTQFSAILPGAGPTVLKTYSNAKKLFQIKDRLLATATYGLGNLGQRSIEGLFSTTAATTLLPTRPLSRNSPRGCTTSFRPLYDTEFAAVAPQDRSVLGFFIVGYSEGEPFSEEFEFLFPRDAAPIEARGADQFGASWRGVDAAFTRLYKGWDPQIRDRLSARDLDVNASKPKKLTNMRAAAADDFARLIPPRPLSLEQAMEFIRGDECVEVTPKSIRLRKVELSGSKRQSAASRRKREAVLL